MTFPPFRGHLVKPQPSSPRTRLGDGSRAWSDGAADYRTRQCTQRCPVSPHPVCGIADDRCVYASEGRRRSRHRHCPNSCPCGSCWPCCRGWRVGVGTVSRRTGCRDPSDARAPSCGCPVRQRHRERVLRQIPGEPGAHGPANHGARVEVEDHRQIAPPLGGPDLGDVPSPHPIRSLDGARASEGSRGHRESMLR